MSLIAFFAISSLSGEARPSSGELVVALDSGWQFHQRNAPAGAKQAEWLPAQVPGCVHTDLLRDKLIPDPFYRDNESKLQWIENADWEYRTTIRPSAEMLARRNIELVFDGLDAYAQVYVDGKLVLTADNMFRRWRVDLKPHLKPGDNELLVVFPSVIKEAARIAGLDKWHARIKTDDRVYIRKAAYEYGWDWGPRFVTCGIWRAARIEAWDAARISDFCIHQRDIGAAVARLNAEVEITASQPATAGVAVRYHDEGRKAEVTRTVDLIAGVNHVDIPIEIRHPRLWYPAGYGPQALYDFSAAVSVAGERIERQLRIGLRSVILRRDVDKWGRSFEFDVNGIPIFCKGADVIPFDSFPNRVTTEQYRSILESARAANMNMIRHWGGGYYETDEFYNICDELGIMVWQDFMFGNDWQPGTYAFKLNVASEAEDQIRRLRNHASIAIWCGNNETEAAFGWKDRGRLPADVRLRMWGDYVSVFHGVLARAVERLNPETPYWPSSPSSDFEDTSEDFQSGDMHDWTVWHGMLPLRDYEKHNPRFMTEYGFQSFPEMRSIEQFTTAEDRTGITTPVMLAHQKNEAGNAKIREYMLRDYPEPKDFQSFVYVSQVLQAEAIKIGAEHLRCNRPRSMGSLFWQLNDCWPVASWSSIDYYGRWKALQYYARRFYNDLLVSPHLDGKTLQIYVVSDRTAATSAEADMRVMTTDGKVLNERRVPVNIPPLSSHVCLQAEISELSGMRDADPRAMFAVADLSVGGRIVSSNIMYFVPVKQFILPHPGMHLEMAQSGSDYRLNISSDTLARSVRISFGELDVSVSDNYFDLIPGRPVQINVGSKAALGDLRRELRVISLADAFGKSDQQAAVSDQQSAVSNQRSAVSNERGEIGSGIYQRNAH